MMETSPVEEVDTLFRQLIEIYDLTVNTMGVKDGTYTGSSPFDAFDCFDEGKHLIFRAITCPPVTLT